MSTRNYIPEISFCVDCLEPTNESTNNQAQPEVNLESKILFETLDRTIAESNNKWENPLIVIDACFISKNLLTIK